MSGYKPPFSITDRITNLISEISEQIGMINVLHGANVNPHLRKENRIRTIHSSLAIENNSLTLEQVTAILNGKRVLGNPNEIKLEGFKSRVVQHEIDHLDGVIFTDNAVRMLTEEEIEELEGE